MAADYLTKDDELKLGVLVQRAKKAKELLEEQGSSFELEGQTLSKSDLRRIIAAGESAAVELVESYSSLVWSRARNFKNKHPNSPELEDLAQEGFLGLVRAVDKYDPTRGNKLSTVAFYWIDQAIGRSNNKTSRLVRLPENRISDFVKISRLRSSYEEAGVPRETIDDLVREELNLSKRDFLNITAAASIPVSLNRPVGHDDSGSKEFGDFISDNSPIASSEESVTNAMMLELLQEKLEKLTPVEQEVVNSSFLLGGSLSKRQSMAEVKERYNISTQKFKRILGTALGKLKKELEASDVSFEDFMA